MCISLPKKNNLFLGIISIYFDIPRRSADYLSPAVEVIFIFSGGTDTFSWIVIVDIENQWAFNKTRVH